MYTNSDEEFDFLLIEEKAKLERLDLSYAELLNRAALSSLWAAKMEEAYEAANELLIENKQNLTHIGLALSNAKDGLVGAINGMSAAAINSLTEVFAEVVTLQKAQKVNKAKKAANAKHNAPGGSRDKQKAIQIAWASGNFTSRDICAEQEGAALGMSFSAARKALRNTPDPT